jgi:glutamate synthase domain-containing protein 2
MTILLWVVGVLLAAIIVIAIYDVFIQRKHAVLHNYPVIGHMRYFLEMIGPELRQYWVAHDKEEMPFDRTERSWIYSTAKGANNYFGFGSTELHYGIGYPIIKNAAFPFPENKASWPGDDPTAIPCLKVMGEANNRRRSWRPGSVVNVSAMSFGALGRNAISALNGGAKIAGCYHNTGEGGVSKYHLLGADVVWQIGTGYFGACEENGKFSLDVVAKKIEANPQIRAIEIKLSQGAKPGKGGVLPGAKVTGEIAETRGIPVGTDCISPNSHSEFSTVDEMIDFIERIAERTGLPVGIKAAVGELNFWEELADKMQQRRQGPDFVTIDGSEGGTGAAPLTYADHVSLPFKIGFSRVYQIFQRAGLARNIVWIGSGKLGFPDRAIVAYAMGCDMISIAREAMMGIGCIQSQACHTGHCPTGVATMNERRMAGLNIEDKSQRLGRYIQGFRKELLSLAHTAGYEHPCQFKPEDIELSTGVNRFSTLEEVMGYAPDVTDFTTMAALQPVE